MNGLSENNFLRVRLENAKCVCLKVACAFDRQQSSPIRDQIADLWRNKTDIGHAACWEIAKILFGMTITNHMVQQHNKAGIMADNGNIREITSTINDRL